MYADDTKILARIHKNFIDFDTQKMQEDIDKIIKWSDEEINILLNILNNEIIYVCLTK